MSGRSPKSAAPRSRSPARSSGARPPSQRASGGRKSGTVSSSTTTRTRRIARSPRHIRSGRHRTPGSPHRSPGTRSTSAILVTSRWPRCRRASTRSAIGTPTWMRTRARWPRCWSSPPGTSARGLGDAPWPPHYRKQAGEPARVQPSRRRTPKFPLIEIGRAKKKKMRSPASSAGKHGIPKRRHASSPPTSSSTRCAAVSTPGRAYESTCSTCRKRFGRHRKHSIQTTSRGRRGTSLVGERNF